MTSHTTSSTLVMADTFEQQRNDFVMKHLKTKQRELSTLLNEDQQQNEQLCDRIRLLLGYKKRINDFDRELILSTIFKVIYQQAFLLAKDNYYKKYRSNQTQRDLPLYE